MSNDYDNSNYLHNTEHFFLYMNIIYVHWCRYLHLIPHTKQRFRKIYTALTYYTELTAHISSLLPSHKLLSKAKYLSVAIGIFDIVFLYLSCDCTQKSVFISNLNMYLLVSWFLISLIFVICFWFAWGIG